MLPVLAQLFGVKVDDLLGINQAENERLVQEIIDTYELETNHHRRWAEQRDILKAALKHFPDEYRLWVRYLRCMLRTNNVGTVEERRAFLPELEPIYENILANCTNDGIRVEAKQLMCCIYHSISAMDPENSAAEQAAAERIIAEMPSMRNSREHTSTYLLYSPPGKSDAACREAIMETLFLMQCAVHHLTHALKLEYQKICGNPQERSQLALDTNTREHMKMMRSMNCIYDAVCPDGDYGKNYAQVIYNWNNIALWHALAGETGEAFEAINRALEIAQRFDALPRESTHTSPLLSGQNFDKFTQHTSGSVDGESGMLERQRVLLVDRYPWPEAFRDDPRFAEMVAQLSK
jgi:hypothetical protein